MRNTRSRKKDGGTTTDRYLSAWMFAGHLVYVLLHTCGTGIRRVKAIALCPRSRDHSTSRYLPEDSRNPFLFNAHIQRSTHETPT